MLKPIIKKSQIKVLKPDRPKPLSTAERVRLHRMRKKEAGQNDISSNQVAEDDERQLRNSTVTTSQSLTSDGSLQTDSNSIREANSTVVSVRKQNMVELDKFKRRMIRTVARLMAEKKTQDEVWEEMKKESGCHCQLLWHRMRILTLKKLKRLLMADDRSESIPVIARMTLTDWLLFDLVLVHEKVDVIGREGLSTKDSIAMRNVFNLVHKFDIMNRRGDSLAEAWACATVHYNSMGHQCSPMLLQRRWYQLMEYTRHLFYKFWFNYRGNAKLLPNAERYAPNQLQMDIAKRFPDLVTKPFLDWEARIKEETVIMPSEFEAKMRTRVITKPATDDNVPDIVVIEPVIETIDLGQDSDYEQTQDDNRSPPETNETQNKSATKYDPKNADGSEGSYMSDIEILESIHIPQTQNATEKNIALEDDLQRLQMEDDNVVLNIANNTNRAVKTEASNESPEGIVESESEFHSSEIIMPQITNVFGNVNISNETFSTISNFVQETNITDITTPNMACITGNVSIKVETGIRNVVTRMNISNNSEPILISDEENVSTFPQKDTLPETHLPNDDVVHIEETVQDKSNKKCPEHKMVHDEGVKIPRLTAEMEIKTDNANNLIKREIRDENINNLVETSDPSNIIPDFTDRDEDITIAPQITTKIEMFRLENHNTSDQSGDEEMRDIININFDKIPDIHIEAAPEDPQKESNNVKLFHDTQQIDVNFADDGIEFLDGGIEYVEDETDVESKILKSQSKNEAVDGTDETEGNPKFDLKLIMEPVVYTVKLDHMRIFKDTSFHKISDKVLIESISIDSKPIRENSVIKIKDLTHLNANDENRINNDKLFTNKHSLCNESDNGDIDELHRVKLSSKLLQKPKSRSYNPIQLCKNPDFNTRLKRLPIGFYSSSRNLILLKACKPMTIDVNKTFESKLLNGVLYLTPSDSIIQIQENEDENKLASSVLPSAMPVQSLINITKISDLIETSNYHPETVSEKVSDDGTVSERSRVINLPDISEIRRINQRLLTAEVTPIRIKNDTSKIQEVLYTDRQNIINDSKICHNSSDIISEEKSNGTIDEKVENNEANIQTIPLISQTSSIAMYESAFIRKTAANLNNSKSDINKKYISVNYVGPWRPRLIPTAVSWLSGPKHIDSLKPEDSLLTTDTLNKMLNLLDGKKETNKSKKKKKVTSNKTSNTQPVLPPSESAAITDEERSNNGNSKSKKNAKVKINILTGRNGPKYRACCCWVREKYISRRYKLKRLSKHYCPRSLCTCCCKDKLDEMTLIPPGSDDEHDILMIQKACESIESVVQQTRDMDVMKNFVTKVSNEVTLDDPCHSVESVSKTVTVMTKCRNKTSSTNFSQDKCIGTDSNESASSTVNLSVTEVPTDTVQPELVSSEAIQNSISVSAEIFNNTLNVEPPTLVPALNSVTVTPVTSPINTLSPVVSLHSHAPVSPRSLLKRTSVPIEQKLPTQTPKHYTRIKTLLNESNVACTCTSPNVSLDSPQRRIVIDGSKTCLKHSNYSPEKHELDKTLFLHSKQLSKNPADNHLYIGKNKILLTNIKLPRNDENLQESYEFIQPKVIPTIPLPNGVQIVLLPNGDVSSTVLPGAELTAEQVSSLSGLLAIIQQQINCTGMPSQSDYLPNNNLLKVDEVINLSDDDDNIENSGNVTDQNRYLSTKIIQGAKVVPIEHIQLATDEVLLVKPKSYNKQIESTGGKVSDIDRATITEADVATNVVATNECENQSIENSGICEKNLECNDSAVKSINVDNAVLQAHTPKVVSTHSKEAMENLHYNEMYKCTEGNKLENTSSDHDRLLDAPKNDNLDWNSEFLKSIDPDITEKPDSSKDITENMQINEELQKDDTVVSTNRKTLLSDLMEMSGISAEDTTPIPQDISQKPDMNPVPNLKSISVKQKNSPPINLELYPITSFPDLKLACERNGSFYKLDFETGIIVPINLCIKKKQKTNVDRTVDIAPKAIVDLTDCQDVSVSRTIFRTKIRSILLKKKKIKTIDPKVLQRNKPILLNKHLNRSKIETTINLVDSDHSMEEEYLQNSSESGSEVEPQSDDNDFDESSDDEPLAKKAKRIRLPVDTGNANISQNEDDQIHIDNLQINSMCMNNNDIEPMNVPRDSEMNEPVLSPTLSFISNHSNSEAGDDCILGV